MDEAEPALIKTYSLEEVAAMVLPPGWKDSARWLARRLNRGELRGYKVGRTWRMTDADVEFLIETYRNSVQAIAPPVESGSVSFLDGLTSRSRSRVRP